VIDGKPVTITARKGVILATGGFDWAPDYMAKHFPDIDLTGAPDTNTGDGQRMAEAVGAELAHMDQSNIAPATFTQYEGRRHAQPLYESYAPHCILVNREGKRFVSEGSASLGSAIDERGPDGKSKHAPVWRVFDSRYSNRLSMMYAAKDPNFVRTADTIEQTVRNIDTARAITGVVPALENIATLFDPPMSTHPEAEWTRQILEAADAPLLLDLHNLYANAMNAGRDPFADLAAFPLERVRCVHLSGGMWISHDGGERRLLDDHVHSPPPEVFELLRELTSRTTAGFDVVLERDGHYTTFAVMLAELDRARAALNRRTGPAERRHA
jgi:hypothetical protein